MAANQDGDDDGAGGGKRAVERGMTRRQLFQGLGGGAIAAGLFQGGGGLVDLLEPAAEAAASGPAVLGPGAIPITLTVNGQPRAVAVEPRTTLLDLLREQLSLTGAKPVCERGSCGACTVMVDGKAVRSCLMLAVQADGAEVVTVEGLADADGSFHPVQVAMREEHALQCGFCTPGVVMTLAALTGGEERPSEEQLLAALSGHICRCTGYQGIRRAARRLAGSNAVAAHGDEA